MPRRYTLGQRGDQKNATRDRIVAAAAELYRTQGANRTSMAQVAAAADVAPGTVRNHFPTTEDLAGAVAAHVMALLQMPDPAIFDGVDAVPDRVARLAAAMGDYYRRSEPWYRMEELDDRPLAAWKAARARYDAEYAALVRAALGSLGDDDEAVAVVSGLLDPGVYGALARHGRPLAEVAPLIATLLTPWLDGRAVRR
jgi:AcrR family transcriptional regulator